MIKPFLKDCKLFDKEEERKLPSDDISRTFSKLDKINFLTFY